MTTLGLLRRTRPLLSLTLGIGVALGSACQGESASSNSSVSVAALTEVSTEDLVERLLAGTTAQAPAIAELRRRGEPALQAVMLRWAREGERDHSRAQFSTLADGVAAQKDALRAGLYWHTDLETAMAEAQRRGVPILSLRMLGDLTKEYSCANSRLFRAVLYADDRVADHLREGFVLHWSSERAVPKMTIDMGDGRTITRTVTGNSIHYVLDTKGRPIDALPGLYSGSEFQTQLDAAAQLFDRLGGLDEAERAQVLREHHRRARDRGVAQLMERLRADGRTVDERQVRLLVRGEPADAAPPAAQAMPRAVTKMRMEMPALEKADLGGVLAPSVAPLQLDREDWAALALRGTADPPALPSGTMEMIRSQQPLAWAPTPTPLEPMFAELARDVATDSLRNELHYHSTIHGWFSDPGSSPGFGALNDRVYAELFLTPRSDPWLGLLDPTTFVGLDHGGVAVKPRSLAAAGLAALERSARFIGLPDDVAQNGPPIRLGLEGSQKRVQAEENAAEHDQSLALGLPPADAQQVLGDGHLGLHRQF